MINEILQWMALALVALAVVGLFRQVGLILTDARSLVVDTFGPELGSDAGSELGQLFDRDQPGHVNSTYLTIVVQPGCDICQSVLSEYERRRGELAGLQQVSILIEGSFKEQAVQDEVSQLHARFDDIVVELRNRRLPGKRRPLGYPFGILVDYEWKVAAKSVGSEVMALIGAPDEVLSNRDAQFILDAHDDPKGSTT